MFICFDCGQIFEMPEQWQETHGFNRSPYEHFNGCPSCGGAYTKTYRCDCCDEWINGEYIKTEHDKRFCRDCYSHMELGDED